MKFLVDQYHSVWQGTHYYDVIGYLAHVAGVPDQLLDDLGSLSFPWGLEPVSLTAHYPVIRNQIPLLRAVITAIQAQFPQVSYDDLLALYQANDTMAWATVFAHFDRLHIPYDKERDEDADSETRHDTHG